MNFDVITIGHLLQDVFLWSEELEPNSLNSKHDNQFFCFEQDLKKEFDGMTVGLGGTAANVAVGLSALAFKTALVSKIGNDSLGKQLKDQLNKKKVSSSLISTDARLSTGMAVMLINAKGEKTSLVYSGASAKYKISDIPLTKLKAKWLYISSLTDDLKVIERVVSNAKKKGIKVMFNPGRMELALGFRNLLPILRLIDLLILNKKEAKLLLKNDSLEIVDLFNGICVATPGHVVIMDGKQGAFMAMSVEEEEVIYSVIALPVAAIDNSGAGDAFSTGLLAGLIKYDNPERALQLAVLNSASVVKEIGAQAGLLRRWPGKSELDKIRVSKL